MASIERLGGSKQRIVRKVGTTAVLRPLGTPGVPGLNADGTTADEAMTAVDANAASDYRVQSDARLNASYARVIHVAYTPGHTAAQRRDAIAAAMASAQPGDSVVLERGKTWDLVPLAGTVTVTTSGGTATVARAVEVPSGVRFDINGGTLVKDAAFGDGVLVINANPTTGGGDTGTSVVDGTFDGAGVAVSGGAAMWWFGVEGGLVDGLEFTDCDRMALFAAGLADVRFGDIIARDTVGNALVLGQPVAGQELTRCHVGSLRARGTTAWPANTFNFPGNPIAGCFVESTFDVWDARDCAGGIKVYYTDGLQGAAVLLGPQSGAGANSGLKLQGVNSGDVVKGVQISTVRSRGQNAHGLWMEYTEDCKIGQYEGVENVALGTDQDIWMGGQRDHIGSLTSRLAGGTGLYYRSYANRSVVDRAAVINPTGYAVQASMAAGVKHTISDLLATDDRAGSALMTRGIQADGAGGVLEVGRRRISGQTGAAVNVSTGGAKVTSPSAEPSMQVGAWYSSAAPALTTTAGVNNTLRVAPRRIERRTRIVKLAVEVTTAGEAGSTFIPVIYADNGVGVVGSLVVAGSAVASDSTGVKTTDIDVTLEPGVYYFGGVQQGAAATPANYRAPSTPSPDLPIVSTTATPGAAALVGSYTKGSISGAPPSEYASTGMAGAVPPRILFQTAATV